MDPAPRLRSRTLSSRPRSSRDGGSPATSYAVYRASDAGWELLVITVATTYTDTGLVPATTYEYRVAARNIAGQGAPAETCGVAFPWVPGVEILACPELPA